MRASYTHAINHSKRTDNAQTPAYLNLENTVCVFLMHRVGYWRRVVVKQKRTHRPVSGTAGRKRPYLQLFWCERRRIFFSSPCVDSMTACCGHWWRCWETSKKFLPVPSIKEKAGDEWMEPLVVPESWGQKRNFHKTSAKTTFSKVGGKKVKRPNANSKLCKMVRMQVRGYRYTSPFLCIYGMPLSRPV